MYDVITFGSATRDVFIKSKQFDVIKHKSFITGQGIGLNLGSKIYLDDIFFASGGGGTNASATFAKQGLRTAYIGKVGNDPGGRAIKDELESLKIRCFLSEDNKKQTNYSVILSAPDKGRTILVYHGAGHLLKKKDIPFSKLKAKWFYIAGLSGESAKMIFPIINFAKKNNIKVALDPSASQISMGFKKVKNLLSKLDILKLNQEEAAKLVNLPYKDENAIFRKLDKFMPGIAVMTKGPEGVLVSDGKEVFKAGTFKEKQHIDRTGAGDAFGSGFVTGWIYTNKIEEAIRWGSANGTSIVEKFGAKNGILSKNQIKKEKRWKKLKITKYKL